MAIVCDRSQRHGQNRTSEHKGKSLDLDPRLHPDVDPDVD